MFFLSIRVLICPRSLFSCVTCASILLFHHGSIPLLFLFLTTNISVITTAPAYTKSFSFMMFPTSILFITLSTFLVASYNLCFSIHLRGGNISLASFDSTFSSMVMSSFVTCIFIFITKTLLLPCSTLGTMQSCSTTSHSFINTSCP